MQPLAAARAYFEDLWRRTEHEWVHVDVPSATMLNGLPVPLDYCVSTVARLFKQPSSPLGSILQVQRLLQTAVPRQFLYPTESLHVSLLGCTQRFPSPSVFSPARLEAIAEACRPILERRGHVRLVLSGLGAIGNQVFVQVLPVDFAWSAMRQELEYAVRFIGEDPIIYLNKLPIHLNIMRMCETDSQTLAATLAVLRSLRGVELGTLEISSIELVITDFVLSQNQMHSITQIFL